VEIGVMKKEKKVIDDFSSDQFRKDWVWLPEACEALDVPSPSKNLWIRPNG
jgi:hypothetical protein